jgi:hypothetical protein
MTTKRPIHSIKRGGLEAAIWTNETKDGAIFYRVTFSRFYRGADGKPANSSSFGTNHLGELALLAGQADAWIRSQETPIDASSEEAANG